MYTCAYIHISIYPYIHAYIYKYIHIYIYTYIHIRYELDKCFHLLGLWFPKLEFKTFKKGS